MGTLSTSSPVVRQESRGRNRFFGLLKFAAFAGLGLAVVVALAVFALARSRAVVPGPGFPYLPLPIHTGMTRDEFAAEVIRYRMQVKSDGLNKDGSYRPGVIEAMTEDHRGYVFAHLATCGRLDQVSYRIVGSASSVDGYQRMIRERYLAAGWSVTEPAKMQVQYTKDSQSVVVSRLFECDSDFPDEPFYFVLDAEDKAVVQPGLFALLQRGRGE